MRAIASHRRPVAALAMLFAALATPALAGGRSPQRSTTSYATIGGDAAAP